MSCCPWRRADLNKLKWVTVINPFDLKSLGELRTNIVWIDQWPSLVSPRFDELRMWLFSTFETVYMSQSFKVGKDHQLLKAFLFEESYQVLWREKIQPFKFMKRKIAIDELHAGLNEFLKEGVGILDQPYAWPKTFNTVLLVPYEFKTHSYLFALSHKHRHIIQAHSERSYFFLVFLHWLIGQPKEFLISSENENQDRRDPHKEDPLSRQTCHRHPFVEKWAQPFRIILRRLRGRKEA